MKKVLLIIVVAAVLLTGAFFLLKTDVFVGDKENLVLDRHERTSNLITVNGAPLAMPSEIIGIGAIGLPVQEIAETLGYEVTWRSDERKLYLVKEENIIVMEIDSRVVVNNGIEAEVYSEPLMIDDAVYVSAPVLANLLGFEYLIESDDVVNITVSNETE